MHSTVLSLKIFKQLLYLKIRYREKILYSAYLLQAERFFEKPNLMNLLKIPLSDCSTRNLLEREGSF
jgi:hypothetical protein